VATDTVITAGFQTNLAPETQVSCLFPLENSNYGLADDRSTVLLIKHHGWRILYMADAGFNAEKHLIEKSPALRADVIVRGCSAVDFSGLSEFFRMVRPKAIVSTNSDFPKAERLTPKWKQMVEALGIRLFDQKETGAVQLKFYGAKELTIAGYLNKQHFSMLRD
jgi:beta-lactamase superfamily II metal-dependent hydrolase